MAARPNKQGLLHDYDLMANAEPSARQPVQCAVCDAVPITYQWSDRSGRGDDAEWGARHAGGGFQVGAGRWIVGSDDGYQRKDQTEWVVRHIAVGDETWTVAD